VDLVLFGGRLLQWDCIVGDGTIYLFTQHSATYILLPMNTHYNESRVLVRRSVVLFVTKTFIPANDSPVLDYIPVEERHNINICPAPDVVALYLFIFRVNFPK
jgi:hypothetical protein